MVTRLKKKAPTVSQLKRKADAVFSQYIRRSSADSTGRGVCVTCGKCSPWEALQCGHFISRGHNILRFDERNCHVQCAGCNVFKHGNYPSYAIFMVETYGQSILRDLEQESRMVKQWKTFELQEIIDTYKEKIASLDA